MLQLIEQTRATKLHSNMRHSRGVQWLFKSIRITWSALFSSLFSWLILGHNFPLVKCPMDEPVFSLSCELFFSKPLPWIIRLWALNFHYLFSIFVLFQVKYNNCVLPLARYACWKWSGKCHIRTVTWGYSCRQSSFLNALIAPFQI